MRLLIVYSRNIKFHFEIDLYAKKFIFFECLTIKEEGQRGKKKYVKTVIKKKKSELMWNETKRKRGLVFVGIDKNRVFFDKKMVCV